MRSESPLPPMPVSRLGYIAAIDGLRAISILSVMAYHLRPNRVPGGYAGVDVFFVISGFVVTASLAHLRFERLTGLLSYFYLRRILRIAPALVVMLVVTGLFTVLILVGGHLRLSMITALAASAGGANIWLSVNEANYFAPEQDLNPFVHTWTLGVEEQFYLIFPFFIYWWQQTRERTWHATAFLVCVCVLSLTSALILGSSHPPLVFFLLPFRLWELGLGVGLCLTLHRWLPLVAALSPRSASAAAAGLLLVLAATFLLPDSFHLPRAPLAAAVAAGLIILTCARKNTLILRALECPPAVYVGKISYSLYLWHWPVYALFRWTIGLEEPLHLALAPTLAFFLAILSYRLVEQPVRRAGKSRVFRFRSVLGIGGATIFASGAALGLLLFLAPHLSQNTFAAARGESFSRPVGGCGLGETQRNFEGGFVNTWAPECSGARDRPTLVAIGDSHTRVMGQALRRHAAENGVPVFSYVKYGCSFPSLMIPASQRLACSRFHSAVLEELTRTLQPGDTVLLPSFHIQRIEHEGAVTIPSDPPEKEMAYGEAAQVLRRLSRTGAMTVLVAPAPVFRSPLYRCSDWFNRNNPVCARGFTMDRETLLRLRQPALTQMTRLAAEIPRVAIWDPFNILCPQNPCSAARGSVPLYWDGDHLSPEAIDLLYPSLRRVVVELRTGVPSSPRGRDGSVNSMKHLAR